MFDRIALSNGETSSLYNAKVKVMSTFNSKVIVQTIAALKSAGWEYIGSVMNNNGTGNRLAYGLLFTKDGKKFYFNKDTYLEGWSAEKNAIACLPIFN